MCGYDVACTASPQRARPQLAAGQRATGVPAPPPVRPPPPRTSAAKVSRAVTCVQAPGSTIIMVRNRNRSDSRPPGWHRVTCALPQLASLSTPNRSAEAAQHITVERRDVPHRHPRCPNRPRHCSRCCPLPPACRGCCAPPAVVHPRGRIVCRSSAWQPCQKYRHTAIRRTPARQDPKA